MQVCVPTNYSQCLKWQTQLEECIDKANVAAEQRDLSESSQAKNNLFSIDQIWSIKQRRDAEAYFQQKKAELHEKIKDEQMKQETVNVG